MNGLHKEAVLENYNLTQPSNFGPIPTCPFSHEVLNYTQHDGVFLHDSQASSLHLHFRPQGLKGTFKLQPSSPKNKTQNSAFNTHNIESEACY